MIYDPLKEIQWLWYFLVGLAGGSFLNVLVYRLPHTGEEGVSLFWPPSFCPACGSRIPLHDNIPLFSYLNLRGKCRNCSATIPWRYPFIEALTAFFFLAVYFSFPTYNHFQRGYDLIFISLLIAIAWIDAETHYVYTSLPYTGIFIGVVGRLLFHPPLSQVLDALLGSLTFVLPILLMMYGGRSLLIFTRQVLSLFKFFWGGKEILSPHIPREVMGTGDVFIALMSGAFLGWKLSLVAIFLSILSGALFAAGFYFLRSRTGKKDGYIPYKEIPFGPYLALGSVLSLFFGSFLLDWYLYLFFSP